MHKTIIAVTTVIMIIFASLSIGGPYPKVKIYVLDVDFYPDEARMEGRAAIAFQPEAYPLGRTIFYLHGELTVDSVKTGDALLEAAQEKVFYEYDYSLVANKTEVDLSGLAVGDTMKVFYSGFCNPQVAGSPSNYMRIDDDGVFLRSYGYSLWFPIFLETGQNDYAVGFPRVRISTPEDYHAVFVGQKIREEISDGQCVSEWTALQAALFDAQCTAQRFVILSEEAFTLYHWPDSSSTVMAGVILDFARKITTRFAELYRPEADMGSFHIMQMPKYGDISSGNVTGINSKIWHAFDSEIWCKRVLGHEMVHPFVDLVINRADPLYALVIEGFPSYFHLPVLEEFLGREWYEKRIRKYEEKYLKQRASGKDRRGRPLPPEKPLDIMTPDDIGEYKDLFILDDRVLLFFNFLRETMGKDRFVEFGRRLFTGDRLTDERFRRITAEYYPGPKADIDLWLSTNEYPERFQLDNLGR